VLYDSSKGAWFDYHYPNKTFNYNFFPSNIAPLWAKCYGRNTEEAKKIATKAVAYLEKSGALNYPGGIPSSLTETGQQWDLPNAWPPHQHMIIWGLETTGVPSALKLAEKLAQKWICSSYLAFVRATPNAMVEKLNVTQPGLYGGGGEYSVQLGFGWSNGVCLELLSKYGDKLKATCEQP